MYHKLRGLEMLLFEVCLCFGKCLFEKLTFWLDNILFNLPYDEERYHKTLEVCALLSDLHILEDGDESEIGERGVSYLPHCGEKRKSLAAALTHPHLPRSTCLVVRRLEVRVVVQHSTKLITH